MTRTAIVTGASRGIGAVIATRLAKDGFAVVVNYAGNQDAAKKVAATITANGGKAIIAQGDVSKADDVRALFDLAEKTFGGVDVLVNNAGVLGVATIAETDDASLDRHININLKGTFNTLREASKRLRDGGRIVNFSTSVLGIRHPGYGIYAATKAAVEALTGIMANEMRGRNICVNAIAPGPTATELFFEGKTQETINRLTKAPPLERLGTPDDIANAVSFLVGPDGGWINGQTIRANGGMI